MQLNYSIPQKTMFLIKMTKKALMDSKSYIIIYFKKKLVEGFHVRYTPRFKQIHLNFVNYPFV